MTNTEKQEYLEFAKVLAQKAGKIMNEYFRSESLVTSWKNGNSPVTEADTKINKLVIQEIRARYPEHGILGEEESFESTRSELWIVDPIDGTNPFSLGMPASTFCLSFVQDGDVQVAVVLDPFLERLFSAVKNNGAYINDQKIKLESSGEFRRSYILAEADRSDDSFVTARLHKMLREKGAKIISLRSFTYMALMITEGKMIAACMPYGSPWDAAAISLIVQESGGKATDLKGVERRYNEWGDGIVVSNGVVHDQLIGMIEECESLE